MGFERYMDGGANVLNKTFAQLTAPGNTPVEVVDGARFHVFAVTLALVDTDVLFSIQGSLDGTTFFDMETDTAAVTGYTSANNIHTATVNGTYPFVFKNFPVKQIRFDFDSENGGTAATLDVVYTARS